MAMTQVREKTLKMVLVGVSLYGLFACQSSANHEASTPDAMHMAMDQGLQDSEIQTRLDMSSIDASIEADALPDSEPPIPRLGPPADFTLLVGVETVTVINAEPGTSLTLVDSDAVDRVTITTDDLGQAHFAYVPDQYIRLDPAEPQALSLADGDVLRPGLIFHIRAETEAGDTWSEPFQVMAVDEPPDDSFYREQELSGIHHSPVSGAAGDPLDGYQYIRMRDGAFLSAMVRFPDRGLYGDGPYPTVIEYSGYSPSRPDRLGTGTQIANALGFATVSVNMRGTGCSGGVFDVFNRAQHADGYDVIEVVARQPWVLNQVVGMVGLSYPGISQLYVASTNPPSLAAIVPLSTIADAWQMQWPGGIYNRGFTRQWVNARERESRQGGSSWVGARIEDGDDICRENLTLSSLGLDFEPFLRALDTRPAAAEDRNLASLVTQIETAVFFGGAFHDEQTGSQFGEMLDSFGRTKALKVLVGNGRHPDGYAPHAVIRWFEFLEFYVARRIPELHPVMRTIGASEFGRIFGIEGAQFPEDRFAEYSGYDDALEAYEAEPQIQLFFESGAGDAEQPGIPVPRFEVGLEQWPSPTITTRQWFLGPDNALGEAYPENHAADVWSFDMDAGTSTFFGPAGYQILEPLWDIDWTRFDASKMASYRTAPFRESTILTGPGIAELWVRSPVADVTMQVTLTEVRPDGGETLVQSGWLRLGHRAAERGTQLRLYRSFSAEDYVAMPMNEWEKVEVALPSFAHPVRAGSTLRMVISAPGRDHGTWEFDTPPYENPPDIQIGYGPERRSSLSLGVLPNIEVPIEYPPCPSLRGQPCRTFEPSPNTPVMEASPE